MLDNSEVRRYNLFHVSSQRRDANELLARIVSDGIGKQDIVLDVGCRSGVITKMLSQTVEHDQIFALDCDKKMVDFAEQNNKTSSIHYMVVQIDAPWNELDPVLRNLEGTVDLVWSNRILHWVRDKATAVANIQRLMKPGGKLYSNITLMRDIYGGMSNEEREENERFIKCVPHDQQLKNWTSYFQAAGLSKHLQIELLHKDWTYDSPSDIQGLLGCVEQCVDKCMPTTFEGEEKRNAILRISDLLTRGAQSEFGEPIKNTVDPDCKTIYYGQFRVIASK